MKSFLSLFSKVFSIVSVVCYLLALGLIRRLGIDLALRPLFLGTLLISLSMTLALYVFRKTWKNGAMNVILGYVLMAPIPIFLRWMYESYLFSRSVAIYLAGGIYAVLYTLVVLYASHRNKKTEDDLNNTLKSREEQTKK